MQHDCAKSCFFLFFVNDAIYILWYITLQDAHTTPWQRKLTIGNDVMHRTS